MNKSLYIILLFLLISKFSIGDIKIDPWNKIVKLKTIKSTLKSPSVTFIHFTNINEFPEFKFSFSINGIENYLGKSDNKKIVLEVTQDTLINLPCNYKDLKCFLEATNSEGEKYLTNYNFKCITVKDLDKTYYKYRKSEIMRATKKPSCYTALVLDVRINKINNGIIELEFENVIDVGSCFPNIDFYKHQFFYINPKKAKKLIQ